MYFFVDIGCIISEVFLIQLYLSHFFKTKSYSWWCRALGSVIYGVITVSLSLWVEAAVLRLVFHFVGITILGLVLFESKFLSSLFCSFVFCVVVALTDTMTMGIFSLFYLDSQLLMEFGSARSVFTITSHVVLFASIVLICLISKKSSRITNIKILLPLLPCWISSISLCIMMGKQILNTTTNIDVAALSILLGLLYTNFVVFFFSIKLEEHGQIKHEAELTAHHYAMQEEVRALWHDISKYLRAMEAQNESAKLSETFAQVQDMVDSITPVVDVNNRVINVILNEYIQAAKDAQTTIEMNIDVPSELPITAGDLYVLIGNTLDNALNACIELPVDERKIRLTLKMHNEILYYRVCNPYIKNQIRQPQSSFHGYGLKNVKRCVGKYHGSIEICNEANIFEVTAHLNCI